jgi:hypothetical protein
MATPVMWLLLQTPARADYISPTTEVGVQTSCGADRESPDDGFPSQKGFEQAHFNLLGDLLLLPSASMEWPTQSGAGSSGGAGPSGAGSSVGLLPHVLPFGLDMVGRCLPPFVICRPPPFPTGIFHPPRAA